MKKTLVILLGCISMVCYGQQSVKLMHYNLLNFGAFTDYCTINNNDPGEKAEWLKTVVDYYIPDLLAVNEISPSSAYQDMILTNVMNTSGRNYFQRAQGTNIAGSGIVNMLYFNSEIMGLAGQDVILNYLRDMNIYKLYFKSSGLANGADTTFLYLITAHLKAGSSAADKQARGEMAGLVMDYIIENQITDACIFSGDFNLQNNLEPAWIELTSGAPENYRFNDPINQEGIWHNNPDFASVHTQSTHINSNGCMSSGGMDDRFDFILMNNALENEENSLRYIQDSYTIAGQDGQRLNGSLLNPENNSEPADIIDALYNLSDHLPVMVDLEFTDDQVGLPATWNYTPTMNSHIITIPLSCLPTLNQATLSPGSYIGAFFLDGSSEKCAGNILWNGDENTALLAYGDDITTTIKDGFDEGEPFILKVFSVEGNVDFYADADFDLSWVEHNGKYLSGGISAVERLDAFYLQTHTISIGNNWSAISSFLIPKWKTLESVFGSHLNDLIFATDGSNIYYPKGNINTLNYFEAKASILIKSSEEFSIDLEGIPVSDLNYNLNAGWNMVSVPIPCLVDVDEIAERLDGKLKAIQSIAGTETYWPEKGIHTLQTLVPGNSYYFCVTQDCTFSFEVCD